MRNVVPEPVSRGLAEGAEALPNSASCSGMPIALPRRSEVSRPSRGTSSRSAKRVDAQKPAHLLGWRLDRHVNAPPTLRAWSVGSRVGVSIRRTIDQDRCCSWVRQRSWVRPREPRERTDCGDKRTEKRCWRGRNRCAVQIVSEPRQLKHHPPQRRSSRRKTASATYRAA